MYGNLTFPFVILKLNEINLMFEKSTLTLFGFKSVDIVKKEMFYMGTLILNLVDVYLTQLFLFVKH